MTQFTVTIMILGLPGLIIFFVTQKLIGKPERSTIEIIFLVFLYSILSYAFMGLIEGLFNLAVDGSFESKTLSIILSDQPTVELDVLFKGVVSGIILSYILSYGANYNAINWLGKKIFSTSRYGDQDVWHYFHNAPDEQKNDGWVVVRDYKENLAYHCYISVWSDSGKERELVLSDVSVYTNDTSDYLYETQHIYLSRNNDDINIEVPPKDAPTLDEYSKEEEVN